VKAWQVTRELTSYALENFAPSDPDFRGFYVVASLAVVAPRYMYEQLFDIFGELNTERTLVRAATIIPQPLAVAIAHKIPTCVVVESGHGNTQVCPISMYPIRNAVLALNRGGGAANVLTSEILKDTGYGDLAKEEKLVRRVKEQIGLLPRRLEEAVDFARRNPDKVKREIRIEGTRIKIDLGDESWTRFLIGEYVFNPGHEVFQSYFKRGMPRPSDVKIGDTYFYGMTDMAEAIIQAVEKCSIELQPHLFSKIILSGGNFNWNTPRGLEGVAVSSDEKIKIMLKEKGIENIQATVAREPTYSVWRGCIVYGYAVPYDFKWRWERMEGWLNYA
jgi:crenactin